MIRRPRSGISLVEVMVAASLSLLLLAIIWSAFRVLRFATSQVNASQEPRKQLRAALANLQNDLRTASFLFPGGDYKIDGHSVTLPEADETAQALAFALPENSVSPLTYSVVLVHTVERSPKDINTPDARSLLYHKTEGIDPPLSDLPGEIDLEALPGIGSLRVFDAYLLPKSGFEATVSPNRQAVTLTFRLERQEARGEIQRSTYQTTLALRNAQ